MVETVTKIGQFRNSFVTWIKPRARLFSVLKKGKVIIFMRLQEVLNKFTNADFLLTVNGWCEELDFCDYEDEKERNYWKDFKNKRVTDLAILTTNSRPELCITIEK